MNKSIAKNPITNFTKGFFYPFNSARFIRKNKSLLKYIIIPFIINVCVFSIAVYLGLLFFNNIVTEYIPQPDTWYWIVLYYFLWVTFALVTLVLVFFGFTAVGILISSPFNEILSEQTEAILTGTSQDEPFVFRQFLNDAGRTLLDESKKIFIFIVAMAFLFLLNFIPFGGSLIYGFLSVMLTVFFLVVEYTGYVFSRKRLIFKDQRHFIGGRKTLMLGFGLGVLCMLAVPFLQFLCIPLGVIGATRLCHDTGINENNISLKQEHLKTNG